MKCSLLSSGLILSVLFSSCMNNNSMSSKSESDTTRAVEFAIRTAMQSNRPEFDSVRAQFNAGDTILFTTDSLPLTELPEKIDSTPLKVLGHFELCAADTMTNSSNYYLYIRAFEKNDSGYYVSIQSLNCRKASNGEALGVYVARRKTKGGKVLSAKVGDGQ